jgi:hypothetical protein
MDSTYEYVVERTFTAVDSCGNSVQYVSTITITDTTPPAFTSYPHDTTAECADEPVAPNVGAKNCEDESTSSVTMTTDSWPGVCDGESFVEHTFIATSSSGLTNVQTQTVTLYDTTPPNLDGLPSDTTAECDDIPPWDSVTGSDCSSFSIETSSYNTDIENNVTYTIIRNFVATDDCGNNATHTHRIHVYDSTPPSLTGIPTDTTIEIHENVTDPVDGVADDNCGPYTTTYSESLENLTCLHNFRYIRTWEVVDAAGNTVSGTQTVTVMDQTPPVIHNVTAERWLEKDEVPTKEEDLAFVYATDNSGATISVQVSEEIVNQTSPNVYTIVRTFTASDDCGNTAVEISIIYVIDTTPPTLTEYPNNITFECDSVPAPCVVGLVDELEDLSVQFSEWYDLNAAEDLGIVSLIIRTWTVVDLSGNMEIHSQTITVVDTTPPVLTRLALDVEVSCNCDTFPQIPVVDVIDNCDGNVTLIFTEIKESLDSNDENNNYRLIRTWSAADRFGNEVEHVQTVTVTDTEAPTLHRQPEEEVWASCDDLPAAAVVRATDNCDEGATVVFVEDELTTYCETVLYRTWSATDETGNTVSHTQTIHVSDDESPVEIPPTNDICLSPPDGSYASFDLSTLFQVFDNCHSSDDVSLEFLFCNSTQVGGVEVDCSHSDDVVTLRAESADRTYTVWAKATDACSNERKISREITVEAPENAVGCIAGVSSD